MGHSSDNFFRERKNVQRGERRCQGLRVFPLPEFFHPGVDWKFNVALAPCWVGFWERQARSVKEQLRTALGRNVFGYNELVTIVTEVEATVDR